MASAPRITDVHTIRGTGEDAGEATTSCCRVKAARGGSCCVVSATGDRLVARSAAAHETGRVVGRHEASGAVSALLGVGKMVWIGDAAGRVSWASWEGPEKGLRSVFPKGSSFVSHASAVAQLICTSHDENAGVTVISRGADGSFALWLWQYDARKAVRVAGCEAARLSFPPGEAPLDVSAACKLDACSFAVATPAGGVSCVEFEAPPPSSSLASPVPASLAALVPPQPSPAAPVVALSLLLSDQLWVAYRDGSVCVWSLLSNSALKRLAYTSPVASVSLVGDQAWLWSSSGTLTFVSPITFEEEVYQEDGDGSAPIDVLEVAQVDARRVWCLHPDGGSRVWDVRCTGMPEVVEALAKKRQAAPDGVAELLAGERKLSRELEDTVKGLVLHCNDLQEAAARSQKAAKDAKGQLAQCREHAARVERDCGELEARAEALEKENHALRHPSPPPQSRENTAQPPTTPLGTTPGCNRPCTLSEQAKSAQLIAEDETISCEANPGPFETGNGVSASAVRARDTTDTLEAQKRRIAALTAQLQELEGIEEQAVESQELMEDAQRSIAALRGEALGHAEAAARSRVEAAQAGVFAGVLQSFSGTAIQLARQDLSDLRVVNITLRQHLEREHDANNAKAKQIASLTRSLEQEQRARALETTDTLEAQKRRIAALTAQLQELEGIEEQAVESQELMEDAQRSIAALQGEALGHAEAAARSRVEAAQAGVFAGVLQSFSGTAIQLARQDLSDLRVVNITLRQHLEREHDANNAKAKQIASLTRSLEQEQRAR
ncbi:hypothetical protein DIPPA_09585 [Diplonema papillatum]|nr:hypothetical protein DIPPA_09585 [Diplonema papillatum]